MIREKTALRYAKELREWVDNREAICGKMDDCDDCNFYKITCWHIDNVGFGEINNALTAIIQDLEDR